MWVTNTFRIFCLSVIHSSIWMESCTSGLTHILTILRKIALQHEVQYKTNKYKLTQKGNKISKWSNTWMWNSCIDQVVAINDTYFHVFLMWVRPLVHDAIHIGLHEEYSSQFLTNIFRVAFFYRADLRHVSRFAPSVLESSRVPLGVRSGSRHPVRNPELPDLALGVGGFHLG